MSYDLTLNTPRSNVLLSDREVGSVHDRLSRALSSCGGISEFLLHKPSGEKAKWFLENDGFFDPDYRKKFVAFCHRERLSTDPLSEEVALRFMSHDDGLHLATVSMPSDEKSCASVFRALVEFARSENMRLTDPQVGADIDLRQPGIYPPGWR